MHAPPPIAARSKTSARTAGTTAARGASAALRSSGTAVDRMRALLAARRPGKQRHLAPYRVGAFSPPG
jgi:hypothetical protein